MITYSFLTTTYYAYDHYYDDCHGYEYDDYENYHEKYEIRILLAFHFHSMVCLLNLRILFLF